MIPLDIPQFKAGNESRFANFISSLDKKDKIALISHGADLDGIASAKITNKIINADIIKFVGYEELNDELIIELKKEKVTKIIMTDLGTDNPNFIKDLQKLAPILIIDHHIFQEDFNSEKVIFINAQGYCAAYLCYYLFSKIQDLEVLDWLVACASISDWMYFKNQNWMNQVFQKYGDTFRGTPEGIKQSKKFWDLQWKLSLSIIYFRKDITKVLESIGEKFGDIGDLEKHSAEVQKDIDESAKKFDEEKTEITDGYFWELKEKRFPIKSIVSNIISSKDTHKTFIILVNRETNYEISARRQDKTVDLPNLLRSLISGFENSSAAGHIPAAGGNFPVTYYQEFKKRLKNL